jgi:hypothetical protein
VLQSPTLTAYRGSRCLRVQPAFITFCMAWLGRWILQHPVNSLKTLAVPGQYPSPTPSLQLIGRLNVGQDYLYVQTGALFGDLNLTFHVFLTSSLPIAHDIYSFVQATLGLPFHGNHTESPSFSLFLRSAPFHPPRAFVPTGTMTLDYDSHPAELVEGGVCTCPFITHQARRTNR